MKFFITLALFAAVASASVVIPGHLTPAETAEIQEIINAINSPSTHPATAAALEQMLNNLLGLSKPEDYHPIQVEPALIDEYQPVQVDMPIIDFPLPDGAVAPSPADVPAVSANSPLVQIIVNVQQQAGASPPASPVQVVDGAEKPVEEAVIPTPVEVVDTPVYDYEPVLVMDPFPVVPEPVVVAPIVVAPAVVAPEILN